MTALSVIVPGHDVADFAAEALDSLLAQTFTQWRAILVDDASTDATGEIFARYAALDPRFMVVTQPRRMGLAAARNAGLDRVGTEHLDTEHIDTEHIDTEHLDTEFIAFLDSDDVLPPDAYERMVGTLRRTGSEFVVGAYVRLLPEAGGYARGDVQPWVADATDPERHGLTLADHPRVTGNIVAWSKVSRADFWTRHGLRFPDGVLYEDQLVAQRMYTLATAFDVIPDVVCLWRVRADGTSITQHEAALPVLRAALDAMTAGLAVLADAGHPAAVQARLSLILRMDVPRLAEIASNHDDPAYRTALGEFARRAWHDAGPEARDIRDAQALAAVERARGWGA